MKFSTTQKMEEGARRRGDVKTEGGRCGPRVNGKEN